MNVTRRISKKKNKKKEREKEIEEIDIAVLARAQSGDGDFVKVVIILAECGGRERVLVGRAFIYPADRQGCQARAPSIYSATEMSFALARHLGQTHKRAPEKYMFGTPIRAPASVCVCMASLFYIQAADSFRFPKRYPIDYPREIGRRYRRVYIAIYAPLARVFSVKCPQRSSLAIIINALWRVCAYIYEYIYVMGGLTRLLFKRLLRK